MIPHDEYGRFCGFLMLKTTDSSWLQKLFILDEQLCFLRYFNQDLKLPEELEVCHTINLIVKAQDISGNLKTSFILKR